MKIAYYSDLHMEFGSMSYVKELLSRCAADVIVVAGDLMNSGKAATYLHRLDDIVNVPLLYVPGNHDLYHSSKEKFEKDLTRHQYYHVQILNTGSVELGGVRFLGATGWWERVSKRTLISLNDFDLIKDIRQNDNGCIWGKRDKMFFEESLKAGFKGKTVCVSHHAPSFACIPRKLLWREYNDGYANNWDEMLEECGPDLWIHGHIHQSSNDFMIGHTRIVSNPYGYYSRSVINPGFREECTIEV